jgi:hypothetical protein
MALETYAGCHAEWHFRQVSKLRPLWNANMPNVFVLIVVMLNVVASKCDERLI